MKAGLFLTLLLASTVTIAEDLPSDASLDRCLNDARTTLEMNPCYAVALQTWDQAMARGRCATPDDC